MRQLLLPAERLDAGPRVQSKAVGRLRKPREGTFILLSGSGWRQSERLSGRTAGARSLRKLRRQARHQPPSQQLLTQLNCHSVLNNAW